MRAPWSVPVTLIAVMAALLVGSAPLAQTQKSYGAASPEEAVAVIKRAAGTDALVAALPVISPRGLKEISKDALAGLLIVLAFSDPDDAMPGTPKLSASALAAERKKYKTVVDLATQATKPYGLDVLIGKPALSPETQKAMDAALDKADKVALITSLVSAMNKIGPMLGMKPSERAKKLVDIGVVTNYKITGDTATAQNGKETIDFVRVDGRWYLEPPSSAATSGASAAGDSSKTTIDLGSATASGSQPEIVVGGLQVAKVVAPASDFSAKPFHSDNGTQLVLWIKMPAGQGLIEINESGSLLQHFGDDKGRDLGGRFGSFPEEFKDGTGGIVTIASSAGPSPGATALVAEGSVAITTATGSQKTRVANVRLQNDQKFSLGQASITIAELETQGDSQSFTLKMPRQVLTGVKDVLFFDDRNQPIEGHRTSSGYMGNSAEMGVTVKTAAKVVTIEFESWQGLRAIKVPFKVTAGFGFK